MKLRASALRSCLLVAYLLFTLAPIYWMVHMSLRSNEAIARTV